MLATRGESVAIRDRAIGRRKIGILGTVVLRSSPPLYSASYINSAPIEQCSKPRLLEACLEHPMTRFTSIFVLLALGVSGGAIADPDKDESGKGHHGKERKVEFWDGNCKVEQKWEKDGEFKEERKCKGEYRPSARQHSQRAPIAPAPAPLPAAPAQSVGVALPPWFLAERGSIAYHPAYQPGPSQSEALKCQNSSVSQALGGLVGGKLGAQLGSEKARSTATAGGTAAGTLVDGRIGRRIDPQDQACFAQVLEFAPDGHKLQWGGVKGALVALTPGQPVQQRGSYCRPYKVEVQNGQSWDKSSHSACRRPDGAWVAG